MLRSVTDRHAATLVAALAAAPGPVVGQTGVVTEPLPSGLYEVLVTEVLAEQLASLEERPVAGADEVRAGEVADRVALHLSRVEERAIACAPEDQRVEVVTGAWHRARRGRTTTAAVRSGSTPRWRRRCVLRR